MHLFIFKLSEKIEIYIYIKIEKAVKIYHGLLLHHSVSGGSAVRILAVNVGDDILHPVFRRSGTQFSAFLHCETKTETKIVNVIYTSRYVIFSISLSQLSCDYSQ